ncbi:hypothetical protein V6N12_009876 [Hibiscus sabdariffa]|uniref:Uncharacterized protein n=1 Tax=Hibiscus sabdariffa TaxID=183260 RepID=A0ABR2EBZ9_9ROSI
MNAVHVRNQKHELTPPRNSGYKKVTDSSPRNIEYKQDRQLFGLRDKPVTQQDALPNSEVPAKIIRPGRTRCLPAEASPLSSRQGRLLKQSTRERHEPERYGFLVTTHGDVILVDQDEPKTYQEAVSSPDSEKWLKAMRSEMDSMSENQVWTSVEPPEGIKPMRCKWVFKKKTDMDDNVQT